uniref:de novo designed protein H4A1R n=1 Tax=Escherichia coli 'BL21-Gold(DE3)pLysS AG' TaxID=866768 RepID=UPI001E1BDF40|nr:Chain A, de novo designed protein H4A1R [Escherichia coli 'BL21-Gold(DE3)pLysS AG']
MGDEYKKYYQQAIQLIQQLKKALEGNPEMKKLADKVLALLKQAYAAFKAGRSPEEIRALLRKAIEAAKKLAKLGASLGGFDLAKRIIELLKKMYELGGLEHHHHHH